jgi:DNA-binding SARP family transcriptional activator
MIGRLFARLVVRLVAGLAMAALVAGIPWMLATLIGWPLPSDLPSWDEVVVVLSSPPTERTVMNALAVVAWAVWVAFVWSLAGEVVAVTRHGLADRRTQPVGRNPARLVAAALFTAIATGSFAHTTSAAATAVDLGPPTVVATAVETPPASEPAAADQVEAQQPADPSSRPGYRAALWENPPPVPQAPGIVVVQVAGQRHDYPVESGATLWELAEAMLGDPRRWPEIRQLNPDLGRPGNGQVLLLLPDDATLPAVTTGQTTTMVLGAEDDQEEVAEQLVYEVRREDWMWHIAGRYLGDEQRYPEIAALNPQYQQRYPDYPDHIQPGDRLVLPDDAYDRGQRPHATGDLTTPAEPDAPPEPPPPEEPADPPPASPAAPASAGPPTSPAPSPPDPSTPPRSPTTVPRSPSPPEASSPTASPAAPGSGPGEHPDAGQPDEPSTEDEPTDTGVVLPTGAWVSFGLAALITAAAVLLRLQRCRRARLHTRPIPTSLAPGEPPLPESLRPVEDAGLRVLDFDRDDTSMPGLLPAPATPPAAVGVNDADEQVSLFDLPGSLLALHGAGAASAVRAVLAAALGTGVTEHTGVQPRVIIPAGTLARLLPEDAPAVGLDPDGVTFDGERLEVVADEATAATRWEEEMFHRRRMCDQHDAETVDELVARGEHPEHLPPLVLIAPASSRLLPRLRAVAVHRHALLLHTVLLGEPGGELPGWRVDPDGTTAEAAGEADLTTEEAAPASRVVRVSTLGAEELAAVLEVLAQVAPRTEPGYDDTAPAEPDDAAEPASEPAAETPVVVPSPAGHDPPPVKLLVLGAPQLSTDAGTLTEGVRTGSVAVMTLLAAHPGGLGLDEIATTLHPGVQRPLARGRVHTDIDAARSLLRKVTGAAEGARFVVYESKARRYALDADLVEVDLWRMLTCIETANRAGGDDQRALAALRQAMSFYGGDFAAGFEQVWAVEHATTIGHTITQAWARIAEILEVDEPDEAVAALESAIGMEPVNEELYRRLMRIHGRTGNPDRVRATLKLLQRRLTELGDSEPSQATRRVADRQLSGPPAGHTPAPTPADSSTTQTAAGTGHDTRRGEPAVNR